MFTMKSLISMQEEGLPNVPSVPCDPRLTDETLKKLVDIRGLLHREESLLPFVDAIRTATSSQLEAARPYLARALKMMASFVEFKRFRHSNVTKQGLLASEVVTINDLINCILENVRQEGLSTLRRAEASPKDENTLIAAFSALHTMAETILATKALSMQSPESNSSWWHVIAEDSFATLADRSDTFRDGVGVIYRKTILELLPCSSKISYQARQTLHNTLKKGCGNFFPETVHQALSLLIGNNEQTNNLSPLNMDNLETMRDLIVELFEDYETTFHMPGFASLLRQTVTMARFGTWSDNQETFLANKQSLISGVGDRETLRRNRMAQRDDTLADTTCNLLSTLNQLLGLRDVIQEATFESKGDHVTLRLYDERPGDRVIIIFPKANGEFNVIGTRTYVVSDGIPSEEELARLPSSYKKTFSGRESLISTIETRAFQASMFGGLLNLHGTENCVSLNSTTVGPR
jgi:hypothetical protein